MEKQLVDREEMELLSIDLARANALLQALINISDDTTMPADVHNQIEALATVAARIVDTIGKRLEEIEMILFRASAQSAKASC